MRLISTFLAGLFSLAAFSQNDSSIYLLVRADDIGSSQAANQACIASYKQGIVRSVEIMVPCPWFPEAVKLLKENPGLDVGVHLVLTSEWSNYKWRPLTCCPSLVDSNGYFYPMVWAGENFPAGTNLQQSAWKINEVEQELRAQITLARKHLPNISHLSFHMGASSLSPQIEACVVKLAKEFRLSAESSDYGINRFRLWNRTDTTTEQKIKSAQINLEQLTPGRYIFVEHPSYDTPEMQSLNHTGYTNVASDREAVTHVLTSPDVMESIRKKGIRLISYADLEKLPK